MPVMPPTFRVGRSKRERDREADARRGSARERGYTAEWDRSARDHLKANPLCRYCALDGLVRPAGLVDHLYPHKGDQDLFWDARYWVSSCDPCHNGFKQRIERAGRAALDALARRLGLQPRPQGGG